MQQGLCLWKYSEHRSEKSEKDILRYLASFIRVQKLGDSSKEIDGHSAGVVCLQGPYKGYEW